LEIDLEEESIDVVLLYDVLHHYYSPRAEDREKALDEARRVLKPNGFVSFYPGDPEVYHNYQELEVIKRQIENADFRLASEHSGTLIHEGMLVRGKVLNFRKSHSIGARPTPRAPETGGSMANHKSFRDHCIVSCGMLYPELNHLKEIGFLDPHRIFYAPPGLHALPEELERQLVRQLGKAMEYCSPQKIMVAYGRKCYLNSDDPSRNIDMIIEEQGKGISRVQGDYGYDMLAGIEAREEMSDGEENKVLWFTSGWLQNWKTVYQRYLSWDEADANANFPGYYKKIIVLDGLGISDRYINEHPERILELFDWTGVEVEFQNISLDRLKGLLVECLA